MRNVSLLPVLALLACSQPIDPSLLPANNTAPVAIVAGGSDGYLGTALLLDGTGSYDPDEDELRWNWAVDAQPEGSLLPDNPFTVNDSRNAAVTELHVEVPGVYVFTLVVDDGMTASETAYLPVLVLPDPTRPFADAGTDVAGSEGDVVCFDGARSTDPRGRELSFAWSFAEIPPGSEVVELDGVDEACFVPDRPGRWLVGLVVEAGGVPSDPDYAEALVTTTNLPPVSEPVFTAGASCSTVHLDGTASFDPDGDPLLYRWDLLLAPHGSSAGDADPFSDHTSPTPSFYADLPGEYLVQLVVGDGEARSEPKLLELELAPKSWNSEPEAVATEDIAISGIPSNCWAGCSATSVMLDALASSDPDGDPLTYTWRVVSGDAELESSSGAEVELHIQPPPPHCGLPLQENFVEVELSVTDCSGGTSTDTVVVGYTCT